MRHRLDPNRTDGDGGTELMRWCDEGCLPAIAILLRRGANVNSTDKWQETAIHTLIRSDEFDRSLKPDILAALIGAGADVNAKNVDGQTPLLLATCFGEEGKEKTTERTTIIDMLLAAGADINAQDALGNTPLMNAALFNNISVVRRLEGLGADLQKTDQHGWTALDHASERNLRSKAARFLIQKMEPRSQGASNLAAEVQHRRKQMREQSR